MAIIPRKPMSPVSVISNICGRCNGEGETAFINPSTNAADTQTCPICRGTGVSGYMDTISGSRSPLPTTRYYADGVVTGRTGKKR